MLHRDIKPQNLILCQENQQVILIDFGIAREFSRGLVQTHTSSVSEGYAPIEQYLPKAERTPATDIYGLAATLYTLVTAQIPIAAPLRNRLPLDTPKEIRSELSHNISQVIMQGMALEVAERPSSVDEWLALLSETNSNNIISGRSIGVTSIKTDNRLANSTVVSQVQQASKRLVPRLIVVAMFLWGLDYAWLRFQAFVPNKPINLNSQEKPQTSISEKNDSSSFKRVPSIFVSPHKLNGEINSTVAPTEKPKPSTSEKNNSSSSQRVPSFFVSPHKSK